MNVQVMQAELREIVELESDVAQKQARINDLKEGVKALLMSKNSVELGRFDVRLYWRVVRNTAWRQIVIDNLGAPFAEECRQKTPANRICELRIEEHAVLPLWNDGDSADTGVSA
jgi:hypothetical protein